MVVLQNWRAKYLRQADQRVDEVRHVDYKYHCRSPNYPLKVIMPRRIEHLVKQEQSIIVVSYWQSNRDNISSCKGI
jgi:hypothetical protein